LILHPGVQEAVRQTSLAEYHRDTNGMHQEIEPLETETAFWEELNVMRGQKEPASLTARH
jgi:hypothetical protein